MGSAEDIIASELARKQEDLATLQKMLGDVVSANAPTVINRTTVDDITRQIPVLQVQVELLEQLKETLDKQHAETNTNFIALEKRDKQSSKQNLWLTITSSAISLVLGWLLSLLGSPATLVHAFGR